MEKFDKGDKVYFVAKMDGYINSKKIYDLHIRTVYDTMMVGVLENGGCICIGVNDLDRVFDNYVDAKWCYDNLKGYEDEI